ncbi:cilia- and flagella-associated protein 95 isoform X1 [Pseudophryne corroboree]|uniref:cilia- and flagella-associated protein 95 isoform X1 n=1 Tax=Pseudophryne corroboree TaxID=495146 RepID=UPI00308196FC
MAMYVMDSSFKRAQLERKGSLYLRSDHMHYDKPTLVSGWHEERETEPKDYDVNKSPLCKGNFRHSTYRRFGTSDIKDWNTTTEEQLSQIYLKNDYELRDVPKKMVNEDNIDTLNVERQTGLPATGFRAVLPHHTEDHRKMLDGTTYTIDYKLHYQYTPSKIPDIPDYSSAYKKCHSQFTDTADYRRHGRNTWQDESGIYGNNKMKHQVFKPTCPITPHL